eukprot:COSAG01_NODE_6551_length_3614_cov_2.669513_3_plen_138_part_00
MRLTRSKLRSISFLSSASSRCAAHFSSFSLARTCSLCLSRISISNSFSASALCHHRAFDLLTDEGKREQEAEQLMRTAQPLAQLAPRVALPALWRTASPPVRRDCRSPRAATPPALPTRPDCTQAVVFVNCLRRSDS